MDGSPGTVEAEFTAALGELSSRTNPGLYIRLCSEVIVNVKTLPFGAFCALASGAGLCVGPMI